MGRKRRLSQENNFSYLTGALVLLLLGVAVADEVGFRLGQTLIQSAIVVVLALGIWTIQSQRHWYMTRAGLVAAILVVMLAGLFFNWAHMDVLWLVILLAYLALTVWVATRQVLLTGPIDGNKIVGAVCIFLLLGLIWTTLYMLVAVRNPEAFYGIAPGPWHEIFPDLVYFSFVSMTTLGYGDIGPTAPIARFLVYAEAITGQFYIAVLVATLVGIRISNHSE
ncbi:potassium channel family protein [Thiorhodococcus minor]|uniref:Two pore domain potassium channel family protein n=1 Tax=Thiorhodococcus minor TaxID=57489 RepID=A0A6M0JW99_9GAMM|nr:potassium channel family protein [Thiorhodococcus minor]NEV61211.1 two pore domain potassium channel family protein [Thiorhodococcus minor]